MKEGVLKKIVSLLIKTMFLGKLKMLIFQTLLAWICVRRRLTWMWFIKQVMKLIQLLLPRDLKIQHRERKAQFSQTYPIMRCFPLKSRTKHEEISVTRASVILSIMFTMKLSISEEIFSIYHREEPEKPL